VSSSLASQLLKAFRRSGWTVAQLGVRAGIDVERSALSRKIRGQTPMSTWEAERFARVLGVTLIFKPKRRGMAA